MSRPKPARWAAGLVVEIAAIALVVSLLPKADLRPKAGTAPEIVSTDSFPAASTPSATSAPWWQAAPAADETSWQPPPDSVQPVNVEQTLKAASQQLFQSVGDYATRAAADLVQPPSEPKPIQAQPRSWNRY